MRKKTISVVALATLGALGLLSAGAMALGTKHAKATVSLHRTGLGSVLVARNGHTLYLFRKDKKGKSACSGSCAAYWPPLLSHGKTTAGAGVKTSLLGTIRRGNGSRQVTYNRHPLYTFKLDTAAGQTNGEGSANFGARWYAVSAKGAAVLPASTTSTTPPPTTTDPYPPYP